ncbi:MAG: hypothetical protein ACRETL_09035, partial [Gammaproteobacteria bacterium]
MREHQGHPTTPLASYYEEGWYTVTSAMIITALHQAAATIGSPLGIHPKNISARSLRSGGATALLCAKVPTDTIRLMGRWLSDEVLRYLHVQTQPVVQPFAQLMVQ